MEILREELAELNKKITPLEEISMNNGLNQRQALMLKTYKAEKEKLPKVCSFYPPSLSSSSSEPQSKIEADSEWGPSDSGWLWS